MSAGLPQARIVFGPGGTPRPASMLADRGSQSFAPSGADPALGLLMTNDEVTVSLLLGAVLGGVRVVSLPLPPRAADPLHYAASLRRACAARGVSRVVARDDAAALLDAVGVPVLPHRQVGSAPLAAPGPEGFDLVQHSSGSTGRPKAIRLGDDDLGANVTAMLDAVRPEPGDVAVSWLPLSHDLGLVGMLLTCLAAGDPGLVGRGRSSSSTRSTSSGRPGRG